MTADLPVVQERYAIRMSVRNRTLSHLIIAVTTLCLGHTYAQPDSLHFTPPSTAEEASLPQAVASIGVCLYPGYFINIQDHCDIEVYQSAFKGGNPFTTYYGCGQMDVFTTFPAVIRGTAEATSPAGGNWSATLNDETNLPISTGTTSITICVLGTEVQAHMLIATEAQDNTPVAQVTLQVIPQ
jgi:hypothetical protein